MLVTHIGYRLQVVKLPCTYAAILKKEKVCGKLSFSGSVYQTENDEADKGPNKKQSKNDIGIAPLAVMPYA